MSDETSTASSIGELNRHAATPLHDQVSERIRDRIHSGEWPPHYKLRAEADLASGLGISRGTIRRALRTLIEEGLLQQVQGRGTFVATHRTEQDFSDPLRSMAEVLEARGIAFTTELIDFSSGLPSTPIARLLDLTDGADAWRIERVRRDIAGEPLMYLRNWVAKERSAALSERSLVERGLFRALDADCGLRMLLGRRTISAVAADAQLAGILHARPGDPLLHIEQITYVENDVPIEYSDVWLPSSRMTLSSLVRRR